MSRPTRTPSGEKPLLDIARQVKILEYLKARVQGSIEELATEFQVSQSTVRRDLAKLEDEGRVTRTFGGAMIKRADDSMIHFSGTLSTRSDEKTAIANAAADLVEDGDSILIDAGTTTYYFAQAIQGREIQVITNSLPITLLLSKSPTVELILVGGVLYPRTGILMGPIAGNALSSIKVSKLFLGVGGITEKGFTNSNLLLVETEKLMMEAAEKVVVLADHSKFDKEALTALSGLSGVDTVVTDAATDRKHIVMLESNNIEVKIADG